MAYDTLLRRGYFSKSDVYDSCGHSLTAMLSSLLWCAGSHRNHRGRNQHSNHIAQPSDPFLLSSSYLYLHG